MNNSTMLITKFAVLFFTVFAFTNTSGAEESTTKKAKQQKSKVAVIVLKGSLTEPPLPEGPFGDAGTNLSGFIARLDKAAADKKIKSVMLKIRSPQIGWGRISEIRGAIKRIRANDKIVYAQLESASMPDYLIAASCDKIIMPEGGMLLLPGIRMEMTFMKGTLEKLGLEADFVHVGKFKGAAEPLTRKEMSAGVRKNRTALIDDLFAQMVETISTDRKLPPEKVKDIIDIGLITTTHAKKIGMIDHIMYEDQIIALLEKDAKEDIKLVKGYGKKKQDMDFSGPMGMFKMMQLMMGGDKGRGRSSGDRLAVIYAVGPIVSGPSSADMFSDESMGSDTMVRAIRKASNDKTVKAIVMRVDSPGGSALASDLIWREVVRCKKPFIISMGDMAASGGYYISMGADKIYAEPGTITGSIGVVGGKVVTSGLMKKVGMTTEVISRGKNSGLFTSSSKFSLSERKAFIGMLEDTYVQFTSKAAEGRNLKLSKLKELAGGQVYTGRVAKQIGLIDEVGTLSDAIAAAKEKAGLDKDKKIELLVLPKPVNFFDQFFGVNTDEDVSIDISKLISNKVAKKLLGTKIQHLLAISKIFSKEPTAFIMPELIEIK